MRSFWSTVNTSLAAKSVYTGCPAASSGTGEKLNCTVLYAGPGLYVLKGSCPTKKSCEKLS